MHAPQLNHSARVYAEMKARLMSEEGLSEDDQALADSLEGCTDLHEQIAAVVREARIAEHYADACKVHGIEVRDRHDRWESRASKLRAAALWAMQEAGLPKVIAPDLTISTRKNKPSITYQDGFEPEHAPEQFRVTKVSHRFDTDAIREALDRGETLEWATLRNAEPSLSVRCK